MAFKRKTISSIKTIGSRLKSARRKKKLTIEQAEEATKVRTKYLKAIEADRWYEFSSRIYVLGYVKRYAEFLGLNSQEIVDEFKSQCGQFRSNLNLGHKKKTALDRLVVTPKLIIGILIFLTVGFIVGYIAWSARNLSEPPKIEITSPLDTNTNQQEITIEGKTQPTAIIEINGQLVSVDDKGSFNQKTSLTPGVNLFEIKAKSRIGKEQYKSIKIFCTNGVVVSPTLQPSN